MRINIKLLCFILAVFVARASFGQMTPEKYKARQEQDAIKRKKESAEAAAIQRNFISLEADVARYCDRILTNAPYTGIDYVTEKYGLEAAKREYVRQIRIRKNDESTNELTIDCLMISGNERYDVIHDLAIDSLKSTSGRVRKAALGWCLKAIDALTDAERTDVMKRVRQAFVESQGDAFYDTIYNNSTAQDLPLIRQVYRQHYKDQTHDVDGQPSLYSCQYIFAGGGTTRSRMLLLMAHLNDADAVKEIQSAIEQVDDGQKRAWGILMAARLKDAKLIPLIAKALDDTRVCQDELDIMRDPDPRKSSVFRVIRTRICDLAVRAIHDLQPPKEPWTFKVPSAGIWNLLDGEAEAEFTHKQSSEPQWNAGKKVFYVNVIVGFTDEQIQTARDSVKTP